MSGGLDNMDATNERPIIATTRSSKRRGPRLSRADRTPLGLWFWEIDRVLLLLALDLPLSRYWHLRQSPAAINELIHDETDGWIVAAINETAHLAGEGSP